MILLLLLLFNLYFVKAIKIISDVHENIKVIFKLFQPEFYFI